MSRSTIDRLRDILFSAELAQRHLHSLDAEALAGADLLRDATLFRMVVVCEAVTQLPAEIQALAPEIPWANIRGMRNRLIHSYWRVDFRILVDTVSNDLGPLTIAAQRLTGMLSRGAE